MKPSLIRCIDGLVCGIVFTCLTVGLVLALLLIAAEDTAEWIVKRTRWLRHWLRNRLMDVRWWFKSLGRRL